MGIATSKDERCIHGIDGYNIRALYLPFSKLSVFYSLEQKSNLFSADYGSDMLIIVSSVVLLWKIKLQTRERFLVLVVFSASILTLLSATAFTVATFGGIDFGVHPRFLSGMFGSLELIIRPFGPFMIQI